MCLTIRIIYWTRTTRRQLVYHNVYLLGKCVCVTIIAKARTDWLAELHNYHVGGAGHQLYMPHGWRARIYTTVLPECLVFLFARWTVTVGARTAPMFTKLYNYLCV
jgi:hypothetical protein